MPLNNLFNIFSSRKSNENPITSTLMIGIDYSMIDSSLASSMKSSNDDCDSDRVKEIHESLDGILSNDLFGLIVGGYDESFPIKYLYDMVMSKPKSLEDKEKALDIDNHDFLSNLALIVKREKKMNFDITTFFDQI